MKRISKNWWYANGEYWKGPAGGPFEGAYTEQEYTAQLNITVDVDDRIILKPALSLGEDNGTED